MKLDELAQKIGARVVSTSKPLSVEIACFYAGDKISELLNHSSEKTLVISKIVNPHIFRVAELVDIPAICLLNEFPLKPEIVNAAVEHGTTLIVSSVDMKETLNRLYECLGFDSRVLNENSPEPDSGK